jgi:DNA-binding MarR family transcriptional regulator
VENALQGEIRTTSVAFAPVLNLTDQRCLGLLQLHGPMSAGALARSTGLTTSAITAAVDRLDRGGYARFGDEELTIVRDFLRALEQASATPAQPDTPG